MKLGRFAWIPLAALMVGAGAGDGPIVLPVDPPPSAVTDLKVGAVSGALIGLAWTAPYDETSTGDYASAGGYKMRYSSAGPITTEAAWTSATPLAQPLPTPAEPGAFESAEISLAGLGPGTYWFALKSWDAEHTDYDSGKGYWSDVSTTSPSVVLAGPAPSPTPDPDPDPVPASTDGGGEGTGGGGCGGSAPGGAAPAFAVMASLVVAFRRGVFQGRRCGL